MNVNSSPMSTMHADVAIVGAGLVGLSAVVALHQAGFSVVLVDSKNPVAELSRTKISSEANASEDVWDARIYAISPKNVAWLNCLGVWPLMDQTRIGKMQAMEIFGDHAEAPLQLNASDANADDLGFIVESSALMQALIKQVQTLGIKTLFDVACASVISTADSSKLLFANAMEINSRLLLAADSSQSWVRQQLNMPMQKKSYAQTAIVANFEVQRAHHNIARQWFSLDSEGRNSILAWLPLPDNRISIVWSVSTNQAESLLQLSATDFTVRVMNAGDALLGDFKLLGSAAAFPLNLQKTNCLVQDSAVLIGDAAHQVHPMAGQGVNLGFRDVVDLLEIVKNKHPFQPLNDANLLRQYARIRKADNLKMMLLTDGLYQLFESQNRAVKFVRNWGLSKTNHAAVKKILVANAIAL